MDTTQHVAKNEKKQAEFYEKQANEKKKPVLSVEDQLLIESAKRENQIKIAEGREMAKVAARDQNKNNDIERQNEKFNAAKENHRRNGGNGQRVLSSRRSHSHRSRCSYGYSNGYDSYSDSGSISSYRSRSRSRSRSRGSRSHRSSRRSGRRRSHESRSGRSHSSRDGTTVSSIYIPVARRHDSTRASESVADAAAAEEAMAVAMRRGADMASTSGDP